jgi:hydroxymethylglutaryl-CoA reductase
LGTATDKEKFVSYNFPNILVKPEDIQWLRKKYNLTLEEALSLYPSGGLSVFAADKMSENVISTISRPITIIPKIIVNNREYPVPLATEQNTILPMIEKGVYLSNRSGGFQGECTGSTMRGQIQLLKVPSIGKGIKKVLLHKEDILSEANRLSSRRKAVDLRARRLETETGTSLIVELYVDVLDSMGANIVDEMAEAVSPLIESLTGGRANVRVLSDLATERLVTVKVTIDHKLIGEKVASDIVFASVFAEADPYRAATHNKGVMNGVSSVLLASGNDTRAVEAGAHAYAALSGSYQPLSRWRTSEGHLLGELVLPMPVGTVGGSISSHPTAQTLLKILGVNKATELGVVAVSVGLASNLGALHSLVTDGVTIITNNQ